jgi:uncharacterized protein
VTARYLDLLASDHVKAAQAANGSRHAYERADGAAAAPPDPLTGNEVAFIASRDSLYLASAGAGGWPYLQHRGGPPGFVKALDAHRLAMPDYRGNRQYISLGNAKADDRVSLFFMDYARRARLKVLARMRAVAIGEDAAVDAALAEPGYKAKVERALVFAVEAFDWNCPQHITPRYTMAEIEPAVAAMKTRIAELEAEVARLGQGALTTAT